MQTARSSTSADEARSGRIVRIGRRQRVDAPENVIARPARITTMPAIHSLWPDQSGIGQSRCKPIPMASEPTKNSGGQGTLLGGAAVGVLMSTIIR